MKVRNLIKRIIRIFRTLGYNYLSEGRIAIKGYPEYGKDFELVTWNNGIIRIGKQFSTYSHVRLSSVGGKLIIGDNVFLNRNCLFVCRDSITVGNGCIFGPNVCIYDHDHMYSSQGIKDGFKVKPIIIEDGCWICANVTILRGTHIGAGCIIGAGSVVQGRIPDHTIVTSNREISINKIVV